MTEMPRAGDLLIAPANMLDPRFHKTVLLLTHDNPEGSFALCVNRPSEHTVSDIIEAKDLGIEHCFDMPLYWGGPVNPQTIWMLHDADWISGNTININEHWSMTSDVSMFHRMAEGHRPKWYRFMFGFAAWAPGQLEGELEGHKPWRKSHSWLIARQPDAEWIIDQEESVLWSSSIELSASQAVDQWL